MRQKKKNKCLHAVIHGRVQGVGFRYSTISQARRLGVTGYAANLFDGTVEVVAEGTADQLDQLLAWLNQGPPLAHVTGVDHKILPYQARYRQFGVKY